MIAEVPAPECAIASGHEEDYRHVRQALQSIPLGSELELVGVGFFDREHEQSGSAANQIELHPVLSVGIVQKRRKTAAASPQIAAPD
jgi:hypothetical protein